MYKHASRNLQRSHRVDRPRATGGYIGSAAVEDDFIPTADNMSADEVHAERRQLLLEKVRAENELIAAKEIGDLLGVSRLGHRLQGYAARLGMLRKRLHAINNEEDGRLVSCAVKEICPPEMQEAIWRRVAQMKRGN